jgi:hypothetical protein
MFLFVSIIAILIWAAFWGAIRLERAMAETRPPDLETAATRMTDGKVTEGNA